MSNVFITWSGPRSHAVAQILHDWLPNVIQRVDPFLSSEDTDKGSNWAHEITKNLRTCPVGIICLTPENLTAPWLLFEAGAISNNVEILLTGTGPEIGKPKVCTYLYDLQTTDVRKPLEMFQATIAKDKPDNRKMLDTINESLGEDKLEHQKLDKAFETYWPELGKALLAIPNPKTEPTVKRSSDEMFREILAEVRSLSKNVGDQMVVISHEIRSRNAQSHLGFAWRPTLADLLGQDWVSAKTNAERSKGMLADLFASLPDEDILKLRDAIQKSPASPASPLWLRPNPEPPQPPDKK